MNDITHSDDLMLGGHLDLHNFVNAEATRNLKCRKYLLKESCWNLPFFFVWLKPQSRDTDILCNKAKQQ